MPSLDWLGFDPNRYRKHQLEGSLERLHDIEEKVRDRRRKAAVQAVEEKHAPPRELNPPAIEYVTQRMPGKARHSLGLAWAAFVFTAACGVIFIVRPFIGGLTDLGALGLGLFAGLVAYLLGAMPETVEMKVPVPRKPVPAVPKPPGPADALPRLYDEMMIPLAELAEWGIQARNTYEALVQYKNMKEGKPPLLEGATPKALPAKAKTRADYEREALKHRERGHVLLERLLDCLTERGALLRRRRTALQAGKEQECKTLDGQLADVRERIFGLTVMTEKLGVKLPERRSAVPEVLAEFQKIREERDAILAAAEDETLKERARIHYRRKLEELFEDEGWDYEA